MRTLEKSVHRELLKKYQAKEYTYRYISTNNLIFNEHCRIVAIFKDYLILDDSTEFLRRFYNREESYPRLTKIFRFYETYSKIFPNYIILPESEYLYKNIRRKQKMIDAVNEIQREEEENRKQMGKNKKNKSSNKNAVFTEKVKNSISNCKPSILGEEDSINNSISISIVSKRVMSGLNNSFMNQNEMSISIIDMLKDINIPAKQKEITVKHKKNNEKLETPKKQKQFIQKIINGTEHNIISNNNKSKSQKIISTQYNSNLDSPPYNIFNNYQNIIIPQTGTVININNNFYQYGSHSHNYKKENNKLKSLSPRTKERQRIYSTKIREQLRLQSGILSPQPSLKTTTIYKRNNDPFFNQGFKSPVNNTSRKGNIFSERTKSSNCIKTRGTKQSTKLTKGTINQKKFNNEGGHLNTVGNITSSSNAQAQNTVCSQKNNTIITRIERKGSSNKIQSRIHQNNLTTNPVSRSHGFFPHGILSPKKLNLENSKESHQSNTAALRTKYKAYLSKNKFNTLSNRNSCDKFLMCTKSKKSFSGTTINNNSSQNTISINTSKNLKKPHHVQSKSNVNPSVNHSSKKKITTNKNLTLKNEAISSNSFLQKSIPFSPLNSMTQNIKHMDIQTPVVNKIKVNRKAYFEKVKRNIEGTSVCGRTEMQTYGNNTNICSFLK